MGVVSDGGAKSSGLSLAATPLPETERLLNRIGTWEDGKYLSLCKLCGSDVPADMELYFCKNMFVAVQVRVKTAVPGVLHEYSTRPEDINCSKGGVYELKCRRSAHEIQVKVQPSLGLLDLINPPSSNLTTSELDVMMRKLYAVMGLFHLLAAFQRDPTREEAPLVPTAKGATRHVGRLAGDNEVLGSFLGKCPVFSRAGTGQAAAIKLADCARPKSRGMLLKALMEVKMLLIIAVEHFNNRENEKQFTPKQLQDFNNFLIEIHEECMPGGPDKQYRQPGESWESLKAIVCGPSEVPDDAPMQAAEAWKVLHESVANLKSSVLPRLQQKGQSGDLELPSTDFSSPTGGAAFKQRYNAIWRRAIEVYMFDLVHSGQYPKGQSHGMALIRKQWTRPDRALTVLSPSPELDKAISDIKAELEPLLDEKAIKRQNGVGKDGINFNPRNSTGLVNPGENLCAANALLQTLFSTEPLRAAVLAAPDAAPLPAPAPEPGPAAPAATNGSAPSTAKGLEVEAAQLVAGIKRVFAEMSHPDRASSCAREVAAALYGKELGTQQDCDELLHRLSLLLQDGSRAIPGRPYESLRETFQKVFVGETYEMRLRTQSLGGGDEAAAEESFKPIAPGGAESHKQFLSIPVQQGNANLTRALEEFTSWSSTGGAEVAWTQDRFRRVPPFLCFASRQVSALEWEEALNLTPFVLPASSSMQRNRYERCKAVLLQADLQEALRHLAPARRSVGKAGLVAACRALAGEEARLAEVVERLEARLGPTSERIRQLDESIGDGFDEPSLEDFLRGVVDPAVLQGLLRGLLGADSVQKLAGLAFDPATGGSSETLRQLVQDGTISERDAAAIVARLLARWQEQHAHMYDLHAIVVYQGMGQFGHYLAFVRQADGCFLCFDDEQVSELPGAAAVRAEIAERGSDGFPASVRMVVYRRRAQAEPLEQPGPPCGTPVNGVAVNGARHPPPSNGAAGEPSAAAPADPEEDAPDAKRRRAE